MCLLDLGIDELIYKVKEMQKPTVVVIWVKSHELLMNQRDMGKATTFSFRQL